MQIVIHEPILNAIDNTIKLYENGVVVENNLHLIKKDLHSFKLDDYLHELENKISLEDNLIVFCSVNTALRIQRKFKNLSRGVILDTKFTKWSTYSGLIPDEYLLNDSAIMMPFSKLYERKDQLQDLFGNEIFIKPDESIKSFSGFAFSINNMDYELDALRQTVNTQSEELIVVDKKKNLEDFEYRCWIIEGDVLSPAGYSFEKNHSDAPECPKEIIKLARHVNSFVEIYETVYTADFIMYEGEPKLVEINGFSTSGFYPDIDFKSIIEKVKSLF